MHAARATKTAVNAQSASTSARAPSPDQNRKQSPARDYQRPIPLNALTTCATLVTTIAVATAPAATKPVKKLTYAQMRAIVMNAPPEKLKAIGAHIMVGYDHARQLHPFLERGAIGGVYITKRNARRRKAKHIASEIKGFQERARGAAERELWIAADQEGGVVSRLTPPLPRQKTLRDVVLKAKTPTEREAAVRHFATTTGKALQRIGVNINFAPVVDLSPIRKMKRDRYTRLQHRAISRDPGIVTFAASTYCETLAIHDVLCTLKHFPGLSRVGIDTHLNSARLSSSRDEIEGNDWVPFREVSEDAHVAIMIGHPHAISIDRENPASMSKHVISGLLRKEWGFDGLVITDDLDMGAIRKREGGMAQAALDALNAGADIILFTFDPSRLVPICYHLLQAYDDGRLDKSQLQKSKKRLDAAAARRAARYVHVNRSLPQADITE